MLAGFLITAAYIFEENGDTVVVACAPVILYSLHF